MFSLSEYPVYEIKLKSDNQTITLTRKYRGMAEEHTYSWDSLAGALLLFFYNDKITTAAVENNHFNHSILAIIWRYAK